MSGIAGRNRWLLDAMIRRPEGRKPLRASIVNADDRNLGRMEAARLLASAREQVRSSEARVASSIVRLLRCDRRLSPAATSAMGTVPELFLLDLLAHPCDLDLLLFFSRHPRAFLTVDDLVSRVGYHEGQIRESLETLQRAGIVTWSKEPPQESVPVARLFELTPGIWVDILPSVLWVASTPAGRTALRDALVAAAGTSSQATADTRGPRTDDRVSDRPHSE
jgi:hypothetical protein